jgi:putative ABC transport system permease protein
MSLWHIAWSYLWNRKFTTAMTIMSVALGVALITTVLTLREETRKRFEEEGQAFDIVVGKGNTLQMVLSAVYFLDAPTMPIPYSYLERLRQEEDVIGAFPITLGDTAKGFRIVGTSLDLMEYKWENERYHPYKLSEGAYFNKPFEAVIGAQVAQVTGWKIGDFFVGAHGVVEHTSTPYVVVGVLERSSTPNDRAIFCDLESTWLSHAHPEEEEEGHTEEHAHEKEPIITAVLVKLYSPAIRPEFVTRVMRNYNATPVVPIREIQKLYNQLLSIVQMVLLAIGYLVVVISSLSILIGLYLSIIQRKKDLAIMRALGASRGEIFGAVIIEAFWVTVLGIGSGWLLSAALCAGLNLYLIQQIGFSIPPVTWTSDLVMAYSAVLLMGMLAGILPAWQAYRSDIAKDLAEL